MTGWFKWLGVSVIWGFALAFAATAISVAFGASGGVAVAIGCTVCIIAMIAQMKFFSSARKALSDDPDKELTYEGLFKLGLETALEDYED